MEVGPKDIDYVLHNQFLKAMLNLTEYEDPTVRLRVLYALVAMYAASKHIDRRDR